ncbi:hypothetical protein C1H46_025070 [Malus baccata]|uniref:Homeobox domain-containing protein n=1 Tax=Malus baccata TaxID=106549 RepID=A0A540LSJ1_MALBA|nr:hypothetical protein C1H46_025070 [Malus baccata]
MADDGLEAFHVPQQSRRDKLRFTLQNHPPQPPFSLPLFSESRHYDGVSFRAGELRSSVPLGPFTGYASILKRSRFLKPAQQLLEDFCGSVLPDSDPPPPNCWSFFAKDHRVDVQMKNSRLTTMLEEVYKRYKLYCQQMESVVASFETIDGLGSAAPYISLAIKAILKHFGCLKNAILDKLQSGGKTSLGDEETEGFSVRGIQNNQNPNDHLNLKLTTTNSLRQSVSRSQRGLPENAVAVLRTWLFEHFLHPYPSDSEKLMLAQQTGLSRTQVSNWFINSRVRIWKPMVEEIHILETQQAQTIPDPMNKSVKAPLHPSAENPVLHLGTPPMNSSSQKAQDIQTKRPRKIQHDLPEQGETWMRNAANGSLTSNDLQRISRTTEIDEVSLALSLKARK